MTEQVEDFPRDEAHRFRLYRLCECPSCNGTGKDYGWKTDGFGMRVHGNTRRCPLCRGEGKVREVVAAMPDPESVGVALVTLAREGEWTTIDDNGNREPCAFGLLDTAGEKGQRWLILPWTSSPRNISDAARVLASGRRQNDA